MCQMRGKGNAQDHINAIKIQNRQTALIDKSTVSSGLYAQSFNGVAHVASFVLLLTGHLE